MRAFVLAVATIFASAVGNAQTQVRKLKPKLLPKVYRIERRADGRPHPTDDTFMKQLRALVKGIEKHITVVQPVEEAVIARYGEKAVISDLKVGNDLSSIIVVGGLLGEPFAMVFPISAIRYYGRVGAHEIERVDLDMEGIAATGE